MPEAAGSERKPAASRGGAGGIVERLRAVHLEMVDAVLGGDGLDKVAALAADAAGAPVAIVIPRLGAAVAAPAAGEEDLATLRRYVADRVKDRPAQVPPTVGAEVPIMSGDDIVGAVLMLTGPAEPARRRATSCTSRPSPRSPRWRSRRPRRRSSRTCAARSSRTCARGPDLEPREVVRRAGRLGCDLARGAVVLCAELTTDRPRHVVATIAEDHPGALAQHMDGRVYALLPAVGGDDAPERTLERARRLAERLRQHGTVGLSSFYADPAEFGRAIQEAELVLDVLRQSDAPIAQDIGTGTYRLLFRVLASHPEEVRSFYEDTVAPIVRYDDQYRTDLVGTLEAYLDQNCNMNATAAAIYAHRHTVAYRLERVKELTSLDPMLSEDRERLGLGLKAYRIIAPRLPK